MDSQKHKNKTDNTLQLFEHGFDDDLVIRNRVKERCLQVNPASSKTWVFGIKGSRIFV